MGDGLERLSSVGHVCLSLSLGHVLDCRQRLNNCWVVEGSHQGGGDGRDRPGTGRHGGGVRAGDGSGVVVPAGHGQRVCVEVAHRREGVVGKRKRVGVGWVGGVEAGDGRVPVDWLDASILDLSLGRSLEWFSSVGDVGEPWDIVEGLGRVGEPRLRIDQGGHYGQGQAQQLCENECELFIINCF